MLKIISSLKTNIASKDWVQINKNFEELKQALSKAKSIVAREGVPKFYIKASISIDNAITEQREAKEAKLSSANNKALNTLKHKMKKHQKEYAAHIEAYLKNPLISESSSSSSDSSDSDSDSSDSDRKQRRRKPTKKRGSSDSSSSSSSSGSDSSSSSSSSDDSSEEDWDSDAEDEVDNIIANKDGIQFTRFYWTKAYTASQEKKPKTETSGPRKKRLKRTPVLIRVNQQRSDVPNEIKILTSPFEITRSSLGDEKSFHKTTPTVTFDCKGSNLTMTVGEGQKTGIVLNQTTFLSASTQTHKLQDGDLISFLHPDPTFVYRVSGLSKKSGKSSAKSGSTMNAQTEMSPEQVLRKLKELLGMRGKRGTNRQLVISDLELLATKARDPAAVLSVQVALVTAYLELNLNKGVHMDTEIWRKSLISLLSMLDYLGSNPNLRLSEDEDVQEQFDSEPDEADEAIQAVLAGNNAVDRATRRAKQKEEQELEEKKNVDCKYIQGNFYAFLYRLHIEFVRSLQAIDSHSSEYIERLRDEASLSMLSTRAAEYYGSINKPNFRCQCVLIQLELAYYHVDAKVMTTGADQAKKVSTPVIDLALYLYQNGDPRQKTRALLTHMYYLSIHNYFVQARDLMLMSHIQDKINDADVATRILFNRSMAQLGLAAFRTGNYVHGLNCLADLHSSQRIKELLGQGHSRYNDRGHDPEQEKLEKKRQVPYHQTIPLDTLESVHLIGGMFAEVENIALGNRKQVSKIFRRLYEHHHRNVFNAPPENIRDLVMHATRSLSRGDWRKCLKSIFALRMWTYMPNKAYVQELLTQAIKEYGLRMYLIVFGSSYVSISLESLQTMFELPKNTVVRITSKMMVSQDLDGVWDQPSQTLVMHASQPSRLQKAALAYADKAVLFVEQNDRLLDQRHGSFNQYKGDSKRWDRRGKSKGNYNNNRGDYNGGHGQRNNNNSNYRDRNNNNQGGHGQRKYNNNKNYQNKRQNEKTQA